MTFYQKASTVKKHQSASARALEASVGSPGPLAIEDMPSTGARAGFGESAGSSDDHKRKHEELVETAYQKRQRLVKRQICVTSKW